MRTFWAQMAWFDNILCSDGMMQKYFVHRWYDVRIFCAQMVWCKNILCRDGMMLECFVQRWYYVRYFVHRWYDVGIFCVRMVWCENIWFDLNENYLLCRVRKFGNSQGFPRLTESAGETNFLKRISCCIMQRYFP